MFVMFTAVRLSTSAPPRVTRLRCSTTLLAQQGESCIIFTTYHSLSRVIDSGIDIDCAYFDEAHNSVTRNFFVPVAACSEVSARTYFFTATPRFSRRHDRGMNSTQVYGQVIENVPAPELINNGSIIPPKVVAFETDAVRNKVTAPQVDADTVVSIVDNLKEDHSAKILVAAPTTKIMWRMLSQSDLIAQLKERDYHVQHITSKHGAYIDDQKVNREQFFKTLTEWSKDDSKKVRGLSLLYPFRRHQCAWTHSHDSSSQPQHCRNGTNYRTGYPCR